MKTQYYCLTCGSKKTKRMPKGHFLLEVLLWLLWILPGVVYSIWRLTTKREVCTVCGSENVIPQDSPLAVKIQAEQS